MKRLIHTVTIALFSLCATHSAFGQGPAKPEELSSVIVVGTQWGDEGKGKIIDVLTQKADAVVRSMGGANAGHTIVFGDQEFKLHLVPSGILQEGTQNYITAGVVVDPEVLLQEIEEIEAAGISVAGRLHVSSRAAVVMPYHKKIDVLLEDHKGEARVGTTGRGIGPCYADRVHRVGIRVGDLMEPEHFRKALTSAVNLANEQLAKVYDDQPFDLDELYEKYVAIAEQLKPYVEEDTEQQVYDAVRQNKRVLFEGAQGTFLDTNFGTYPYVTSSSTLAAGICTGAGIGPSLINHTLGVVKAYTTRVGYGPLPTAVSDEELFLDHALAREFGATTGRKRRIGHFDAVLVREAVRINGIQSLAVTKLDILDSSPEVRICVGYQIGEKTYDHLPALNKDMEMIEPIYITMPGWEADTSHVGSLEELPPNARRYVEKIAELCEVPVSILSIGPDRAQTIWLADVLPF